MIFTKSNVRMIDDVTRIDDYLTAEERAQYKKLRSQYEAHGRACGPEMAGIKATGAAMDAILRRGYERMKKGEIQ